MFLFLAPIGHMFVDSIGSDCWVIFNALIGLLPRRYFGMANLPSTIERLTWQDRGCLASGLRRLAVAR